MGGRMNSKTVLTATAILGVFGAMWIILPAFMGNYWGIAPGDNLNYMGHRYGAVLLGLGVAVWLARGAPNTQARRALMGGALVALVPTTALSLYGALGLGLNAWAPFVVELALALGLVWVLFIKPEPLV
jgi:hypothetical protein